MRLALFAGAAIVACAACTKSPADPTSSYATVTITDFTYGPDTVTIAAGKGVRWVNHGPSTHSATADSGAFNSGALGAPGSDGYGGMTAGGAYARAFSTPGTFAYHCAFHAQMTGTLIVTP